MWRCNSRSPHSPPSLRPLSALLLLRQKAENQYMEVLLLFPCPCLPLGSKEQWIGTLGDALVVSDSCFVPHSPGTNLETMISWQPGTCVHESRPKWGGLLYLLHTQVDANCKQKSTCISSIHLPTYLSVLMIHICFTTVDAEIFYFSTLLLCLSVCLCMSICTLVWDVLLLR